MSEIELLNFLEEHITERRKSLFKKIIANRTRYLTVVLENIYQPHNASAVVRTCECFGIQDLHIIEKEHSFKANSGIVMGANKWIDFHHYKSSSECIEKLRKSGYRIIATMPNPNESGAKKNNYLLESFNLNQKTAFFFGEESVGLSDEVAGNADGFLTIPMYGFTESFNISVTVAIVLHHLTTRLRRSKKIKWKLREDEMLEKKIDWAVKSINRGPDLVKYFYEKKQNSSG